MRYLKVIIFGVLLLIASLSWAEGPQGVVNGPHNLSATGVDQYAKVPGSSLYRTDEYAVCVFCHTPHGGSLTTPLWNRSSPSSTWSHYNSATMSIDGSLAVNRAPSEESMLCLSCHDGSISVNHLLNTPNWRTTPIQSWSGDPDQEIIDDIISGSPASRIGGSWADSSGTGDLSDDHPISFSYSDVLATDDYLTGHKAGDLNTVGDAENAGVRFFGTNKRVECSSCHDPHVNYIDNPEYTPFLITSNSGSALCLACHVK